MTIGIETLKRLKSTGQWAGNGVGKGRQVMGSVDVAKIGLPDTASVRR